MAADRSASSLASSSPGSSSRGSGSLGSTTGAGVDDVCDSALQPSASNARSAARRLSSVPFFVLVVLASLVRADDAPVLHEYVPDIDSADLAFVDSPGGSGEPSAILYDGEILSRPQGGGLSAGERAMTARPGSSAGTGDAGRRSPTFRPDRITSLDGTLGYYSVFTPSIAPFKRVTSLDAVVRSEAGVPVLGSLGGERRPVPVEGASTPAPDLRPRDRFWGSVVLDFRTGDEVPFPSVSPESRILTLQTEPETSLAIVSDESGNFIARSFEPAGEVRVVFLMDAPRSYFNAEFLPASASDVLEDEVPPLTSTLRTQALTFAAELGIRRGDPLPDVLGLLTNHFRSFVESDEAPVDSGNIYLDLARSKKGVCRHRAYAFLITAQALGIPTRFVHNEAHAWVEVKIVEVGWMRIDLGGAANGLDSRNSDDRPVYRAPFADPLPRPSAYEANAARMSTQSSGFRASDAEALAGEPNPRGPPNDSQQANPSPANPPRADARPVRILLDQREPSVLRGRTLTLSGRILDPENRGVGALRVEILIRRRAERLLGVTVSGTDGSFRLPVGVPPDLDVGTYSLIVRTPGNNQYYSATAF